MTSTFFKRRLSVGLASAAIAVAISGVASAQTWRGNTTVSGASKSNWWVASNWANPVSVPGNGATIVFPNTVVTGASYATDTSGTNTNTISSMTFTGSNLPTYTLGGAQQYVLAAGGTINNGRTGAAGANGVNINNLQLSGTSATLGGAGTTGITSVTTTQSSSVFTLNSTATDTLGPTIGGVLNRVTLRSTSSGPINLIAGTTMYGDLVGGATSSSTITVGAGSSITGDVVQAGTGTIDLANANVSGGIAVTNGTVVTNGVTAFGDLVVGLGGNLVGDQYANNSVGNIDLLNSNSTAASIGGINDGDVSTFHDAWIAQSGTGSIVFGGALNLNATGMTDLFPIGTTWDIFQGGSYSGSFSSFAMTGDAPYDSLSWTYNDAAKEWTSSALPDNNWLVFQETSGNLVVVPEPSTMVFASFGMAMAGWSAWKKRRLAKMLAKN